MTFLRHRCTSRRHTPLWVLLLGMRQPRVAQPATEHNQVADVGIEDMGHRSQHRWKRSLRAPMVLRVCWRLGMRRDATDREGHPA